MKKLAFIIAASVFAAYILNNANYIPDLVWWMLPAWIWSHVNYYVTLPVACFILIGVPVFLVSQVFRTIKRMNP
jgi:hypothetical protein